MKIFSLCADYNALDKMKNEYKNPILIVDPKAIYLCSWISHIAENSIITYKSPFSTIPKHFKACLIKELEKNKKCKIDAASTIAIGKLLDFLNTYCDPEEIIYLRIYYDI